MNPATALKEARAAGVRIGVDGDDLVLEASAPPAAAVLDHLSSHKAAIVALLRLGCDGWYGSPLHIDQQQRWPRNVEHDASHHLHHRLALTS